MIVMLMWLTAQAVRLRRLPYSPSVSRLVIARTQQRHLCDIGLTSTYAKSQHLHFVNAEAQLGMIR